MSDIAYNETTFDVRNANRIIAAIMIQQGIDRVDVTRDMLTKEFPGVIIEYQPAADFGQEFSIRLRKFPVEVDCDQCQGSGKVRRHE